MTNSNGTESRPQTPRGLDAAGRKLWDSSTDDYEWAKHELAMLEEACRTRDQIVRLDAAVKQYGVMIDSSQGLRLNPAIAEARQNRGSLARLLYTLGIPPLEDDVLPKSTGVRGFYRGSGTI